MALFCCPVKRVVILASVWSTVASMSELTVLVEAVVEISVERALSVVTLYLGKEIFGRLIQRSRLEFCAPSDVRMPRQLRHRHIKNEPNGPGQWAIFIYSLSLEE